LVVIDEGNGKGIDIFLTPEIGQGVVGKVHGGSSARQIVWLMAIPPFFFNEKKREMVAVGTVLNLITPCSQQLDLRRGYSFSGTP
ncbi:MAG TPA: hypothetical protein VJ969_08270, partial [Desulfopila sp.]|nr:hypothetical protein [Desulfopila sp.]